VALRDRLPPDSSSGNISRPLAKILLQRCRPCFWPRNSDYSPLTLWPASAAARRMHVMLESLAGWHLCLAVSIPIVYSYWLKYVCKPQSMTCRSDHTASILVGLGWAGSYTIRGRFLTSNSRFGLLSSNNYTSSCTHSFPFQRKHYAIEPKYIVPLFKSLVANCQSTNGDLVA
jgi:hypothetical protein